ncbi:MAG TPA: 1,4-alpha-glucan branching protein domain-containing protein [Thermoanaerobaculia bacterium]|nr:1,4-alpha-glucan branching protein domain-containing protein [Thermoanaerobaculia bacterium]
MLEFEQRPLLEAPVEVRPPARPGPLGAPRRLAFVLHAHLPWVLGHGTWPHGEDWLAEAVVHCYLPLLDAFRRLAERGRRRFVTLSVTPILGAMFADPRTPGIVDRYLAERSAAAQESRRRHPLALWWIEEYERLRILWESFDKDLIRALRELSDRGAVELSTSAGTHVYLPLAHTTRLARLALRVGRESHRELFGVDPRGCWMPECAYRPGGPWRHPVTGAAEELRPGNEELLEEQGLDWTVLDAHLLRQGDPAFPYLSDLPPEEVAEPGGPHPHPYWIRRSSVAAFLRDARSAAQVWSRQGGYPGDGAFLDFHKRHWPSGLRLWRVTGSDTDLPDKLAYFPQDAERRAREQAEHFVRMVAGLDGMGGGVVAAPFDAELFGHWWFEGPVWLERVLELCAPGSAVEATTPAHELDAGRPLRRAFFAEGSWGAGGDHRVWVNPGTEWFWHELAAAEQAAFAAVRWGGSRAWRRAILNQLLLAAASDWPFLVTMETGGDYAERRFREHIARVHELIELGPRSRALPDWVAGDLPFPDLEPEWARPPEQ